MMPARKVFLIVICSVLLQPSAAWAYLAGEAIELSWEIVINRLDGHTQPVCKKSVTADVNPNSEWNVVLSVSAGDSKKKRKQRVDSVPVICNGDSSDSSLDAADTGPATLRLSAAGNIQSTLQRRMEYERVLVVEISANVQLLQSADNEESEPLFSNEFSREFIFSENDSILIPLWSHRKTSQDLTNISEVFLKVSAREPKIASKSVYGSVWLTSDVADAEFLLDGGVIGQTGESGELAISNIRAGIHLAELRHPDIDDVRTFIRVEAGRKALIDIARPGSVTQDFQLKPLGENEQGFPEYQRSSDGAVVVKIPEGEFLMGNRKTEKTPLEHMVWVSGFLMDKTGVSWKQYRQFAADTGISLPPHDPYWGIVDEQPAVYVTWEESKAYCEWAGGRLPTEAEREKAARGLDGRLYPWGEQEPNDDLGVFRKSWGYAGPGAVGARPAGVSPYGLMDMGGNVWEWCADWYSGDYYENSPYYNPKGPETGLAHVVRGGSWDSRPTVLSASCRNWGHRGYRDGDFGFRCAMNSPE